MSDDRAMNGTVSVSDDRFAYAGLRHLQRSSWQTSEDHGFHEDLAALLLLTGPAYRPLDENRDAKVSVLRDMLISMYTSQKLELVHDELSEAHEEVRSGNLHRGIYWKCKDCGVEHNHVLYDIFRANGYKCQQQVPEPGAMVATMTCGGDVKPEGVEVELADAVIRILDLSEILDYNLSEAMEVKGEYNRTRPYKHGRQF